MDCQPLAEHMRGRRVNRHVDELANPRQQRAGTRRHTGITQVGFQKIGAMSEETIIKRHPITALPDVFLLEPLLILSEFHRDALPVSSLGYDSKVRNSRESSMLGCYTQIHTQDNRDADYRRHIRARSLLQD